MDIEQLSGPDGWRAIQPLSGIVYPPEVLAQIAWRHVDWAHAAWYLVSRDAAGEPVSAVGGYHRVAELDGKPVRLGGIGSVMTHPQHRRRGLVRAGLERAVELFTQEGQDAALLFCESHNVEVYARMGWRLFRGGVIVEQPNGPLVFTMMHTMVRDVGRPAPEAGRLDLRGKPW